MARITTCANCGISDGEWLENDGQGYRQGDATYCCQECAEQLDCACAEVAVAIGLPGLSAGLIGW